MLGSSVPRRQSASPAGTHGQRRRDLVVAGDAVQIPDVVLHFVGVVDVAERGIEGADVEAECGAQFLQQFPGFLHGDFAAVAEAGPVDAVGADADDQLLGIDVLEALVELELEPALASERAGLGILGVLVIGRQDQRVGGVRQALVVVIGIGGRHRHQQAQLPLREHSRELLHEGEMVRLRGGGKVLQREDDAAVAAVGDVAHDLGSERRTRLGRGQHGGGGGAFPALGLGVEVVDERDELERGCVVGHPAAHHRLFFRAVADDASRGVGRMQPLDDHRVERLGVLLERGEAVVVPVHEVAVAGDVQRRLRRPAARTTGAPLRLIEAGRRHRRRQRSAYGGELQRRKVRAPHARRHQGADKHRQKPR